MLAFAPSTISPIETVIVRVDTALLQDKLRQCFLNANDIRPTFKLTIIYSFIARLIFGQINRLGYADLVFRMRFSHSCLKI